MNFGKRKRDSTIDSYFRTMPKKSKYEQDNPQHNENDLETKTASEASPDRPTSSVATDVDINLPSTSENSEKQHPKQQNDIGFYIGKSVDDFTRNLILENPWVPDEGYKYPYSVHSKGKGETVKRYLSKEHINKYDWLVYSDYKQGLFCKYCALFAMATAGHNKGVKLQTLVTIPLTKFKDLTSKDGYLQTHDKNAYHKDCINVAKTFLRTYREPQLEVVNLLSSQRLKQVEENRARLRPIIESIMFLGRQNIAFRGHRDDGRLLPEQEQSEISNEGNFRALLNFRIQSGDTILESHLRNASSRATYISKTTQNILINYCGEQVTLQLVEKIKRAGYWSIIFDETTDQAHIEQIVIVIRYFDGNLVREDFIKFIDAYESICKNVGSSGLGDENLQTRECKLTGKCLAEIVLKYLADLGLDLKYCVGIGTDGCSVMTSEKKGAVSEILKVAYNAKHVSCYNHALNNSISKSSKIQCVRNTLGVVKEVVSFFNQSAKRNCVMKSVVGMQLMSLCETRWVERHDSLILFSEALSKIITALEQISRWTDNNSARTAGILMNTLCTTDFIIGLNSTIDVLKITLPLSRLLQTPTLDLKRASDAVSDTLSTLKLRRENVDNNFSEVYGKVLSASEELQIELKLPRLGGRQVHRENYNAETVEIYYKRSVYIPLLENVINDLENRFSQQTLECYDLRLILPSFIVKRHQDAEIRIKKVATMYEEILPGFFSATSFEGELAIWEAKWQKQCQNFPNDVSSTLAACDKDLFPTMYELLKILLTLPVSAASAERSFSTLKRTKTWLRSKMGEERLNGLCLLYIHREMNVSVDKIIERYAKSGSHRLEFAI